MWGRTEPLSHVCGAVSESNLFYYVIWLFKSRIVAAPQYGIQASYFAFVITNILAEYLQREQFQVACAVLKYANAQGVDGHTIRKALARSKDLQPMVEHVVVTDVSSILQ